MEKNIKESISIIQDVVQSMPQCTNKSFLKGALNELNEALIKNNDSMKTKVIETLERKEKLLQNILEFKKFETQSSILNDLDKNEIELKSQISLLVHLLND